MLLRYTSGTGTTVALPVHATSTVGGLLVLAGHAGVKRWWRRFRTPAVTAAVVVAYAAGLLPAILAGTVRGLSPVVLAAAGVDRALMVLLTIGTAQWLVLRSVLPRRAGWIGATALT